MNHRKPSTLIEEMFGLKPLMKSFRVVSITSHQRYGGLYSLDRKAAAFATPEATWAARRSSERPPGRHQRPNRKEHPRNQG